MRALGLAVIALALMACNTTTLSGPKVSVFKQQATGYALMSTQCPDAALGLDDDKSFDPMCSTTADPTLYAGVDLVVLVIDYGDVDFSPTMPPTSPTVSITTDGAPSTISANVTMRTPMGHRNYYVAKFVAPQVASGDVEITVSAGTGFSTNVETIFKTTAPPVKLSLLKRMSAGCYAPITDAPDASLGLASELCASPTTADTKLAAGIDQLQTVIDYGPVDFGSLRTVPSPTMQITADGRDAQPGISIPPLQKAGGHVFFVVPWQAPQVTSKEVRVTVALGGLLALTIGNTLSTERPDATVSVLRRTETGCFEVINGVTPSSDLSLPATCGSSTGPFYAAVDYLEILIDYGAIDDLGAVTVPSPTVSLSVDGADTTAGITVSPLQRAGHHIFFVATMHAPSTPSNNVLVRTSLGVGAPLTFTFATTTPPITVDVVECSTPGTCDVVGAVDTVNMRVSVPGDVPQTIALHSTVGGVLQSDPVSPMTTKLVGGHTEVTFPIPVPPAPDGTAWSLDAQLADTHESSPAMTIRQPTITATLTASGTIATGSTVGLTVSAPQNIRPQQASYSTFLDASPIALGSTLPLVDPGPSNKTISGSTSLTAPAKAGTWTINVSVAGYKAQSLSLNVQ
jgi:hypothetical protein